MSEAKAIRIPFDSFVLSAVVRELQEYIGAKLQDIRQPNENDVVLSLYHSGHEAMLLLSCHPEFARAHFVTKRVSNQSEPPVFCSSLRSRLYGARLVEANQIEGDRVLDLVFDSSAGVHRIVAELMGKHSNLMLVDAGQRIVSAAKWVGRSKSSRPIQPNGSYELPPVMGASSKPRRSPFLVRLLEALGTDSPGPITPVISPGHGAYPVSVASLGLPEHHRSTVSIALEQHFATHLTLQAIESAKAELTSHLRRTLLAKEVALKELKQAEEAGGKAAHWQLMGDLLLAYGPSTAIESDEFAAWDYQGEPIFIRVDPDLDFKANANRYYDKAKKAKGRLGIVADQLARLIGQRSKLLGAIDAVHSATKLIELETLREDLVESRLLIVQHAPASSKEDRPYAGHRIRELVGPGGFVILFGENAESNDYLTLRVAKPNDLWLHVRGDVSAHVVVRTQNHPEKVQAETLRFAAQVAVKNSKAKHSSLVAVDYTLKKYVRKQKGGAKGSVFYTHEKTIDLRSD